VGFDSEVLEQWKQDIERVRDSLKRLQEERVGLKRPESLEKFQQLQQLE
jgi:diphthamide synthase subunit DPH2